MISIAKVLDLKPSQNFSLPHPHKQKKKVRVSGLLSVQVALQTQYGTFADTINSDNQIVLLSF
jgi:hypothetical protein